MKAPNPHPPQGSLPQRGKSAICFKILKIADIHTVPILRLFGALCAVVFCSNPDQAAPDGADESGVQLTIELRDGSRIIGKSLEDTLSIHCEALGDIKPPWAAIRSIDYADTNTVAARLTAANGDRFATQLVVDFLRVETGFGQLGLPVRLIRSVKVTPRGGLNAAAARSDLAQLAIELRDGSHFVGRSLENTLSFHSPAMGDLNLTWAGIRSIEYADTNTGMATLTVDNSDVYEVQFAVSSLGVATILSKTELPVKLIRSVTVLPAGPANLIDVAFTARVTTKAGFAATGLTSNDFWNSYSAIKDSVDGNFGAAPTLRFVDGTASGAGLTVANARGGQGDDAFDPMYQSYLYPSPVGGKITVTVTNLSPGLYDFYLYGHGDRHNQNSVFELSVGGVSIGSAATINGVGWDSPVWQEGVQYVEFPNVSVAAGQTVTIYVKPGASQYAVISGLQIAPAGMTSPALFSPPAGVFP